MNQAIIGLVVKTISYLERIGKRTDGTGGGGTSTIFPPINMLLMLVMLILVDQVDHVDQVDQVEHQFSYLVWLVKVLFGLEVAQKLG